MFNIKQILSVCWEWNILVLGLCLQKMHFTINIIDIYKIGNESMKVSIWNVYTTKRECLLCLRIIPIVSGRQKESFNFDKLGPYKGYLLNISVGSLAYTGIS